MSDTIVEQPVVVDEQAQAQAELARNMAISLNGGFEPKAEPSTENIIADNPPPPTDAFGVFREKYGYQTPEDAFKEIEELRQFKAAPVTTFEFENEDTAKLFKAWQAGKKDEVYTYLAQERQIDNLISKDVTKETAADYVKLGMQLKFKDLTTEEINYKFNKQFGVPSKPVQTSEEDDAEYQNRVNTWKELSDDRQMELLIEAKLAKPEVANSKAKLVFPEIDVSDEGYAQYKKMLSEQAKSQETQAKENAEIIAAYKAFTPKALETRLNFKDEPNKIALEFQYEPDNDGFAKAVEMASDIDKFYDYFNDQKGNPDRKKFLDFVYTGLNKDKILTEAMNQAKNATIKSSLPDNGQNGLLRQMPQSQDVSEFDKQMRMALKGHGGF